MSSGNPTPASVEEDFSLAWEHLFRAVRRLRTRVGSLGASDLTLAQYQLLAPLWEGPQPTGVLAAAAGVAAPTATRSFDALERAGVIERSPSPSDRRTVLVELTPQGRGEVRSARQAVRAHRRRIAEQLTEGDRAEAARLLHLLADAVERA